MAMINKKLDTRSRITDPKALVLGAPKISMGEGILIVLADQKGKGNGCLTVDELAVRCWQRWPERFGIMGGKHPSDNKIMVAICHKAGPVHRGLMRRVAPSTFQITSAGESHVAAILGDLERVAKLKDLPDQMLKVVFLWMRETGEVGISIHELRGLTGLADADRIAEDLLEGEGLMWSSDDGGCKRFHLTEDGAEKASALVARDRGSS